MRSTSISAARPTLPQWASQAQPGVDGRRGGMEVASASKDERRESRRHNQRGEGSEEEGPAGRARDRCGVADHWLSSLLVGCVVIPGRVVGQRDREDRAGEDGTADGCVPHRSGRAGRFWPAADSATDSTTVRLDHLRRTEKSKEIKCEEGDLNPHGCLAH